MIAQPGLGQGAVTQPAAAGVGVSAALASFDVVSIKPLAQDGRMMRGFRYLPDGIQADATTVSALVWNAYGGFTKLPTEDSVTGLPDWTKTQYFAVQAKMSEAQTAEFAKLGREEKQQRLEAMLQALLADRFKLKVHRELKQVPDYELVMRRVVRS
jgi:uncharacterized protein (TIGR03435 family)